jgi:uncharacterized protein (DUF2252 family)
VEGVMMMTNGANNPVNLPMDEAIEAFLRDKVNSFIKWDLVRFFHDTPYAQDTAENIARYTGRDIQTIEDELADLVDNQVLIRQEISDKAVYGLVDDVEVREIIHRFMEACHDRNFRVKVINQVIQARQFSPRHDF